MHVNEPRAGKMAHMNTGSLQTNGEGPPCEHSPLLATPTETEKDLESLSLRECADKEDKLPLREIVYDELGGVARLAVPIVATYLLEMLPGVVSIILVGHISGSDAKVLLDATALGVMFLNLTGLSVGIGLATAMDTLCSQAFGASETQIMGTYLQTGVIVLSLTYILVCFIFYHSTQILIGLGQPLEVTEHTGKFLLYLLPGVPFVYLYELLRKVLQSQNIGYPMLYVAIASNIVNAALGYYLVYHTQWGWLGAAVARTVCNMCLSLFLLPYVIMSGLVETFWSGIHPQAAIRGVGEFLALGIPGMLQLCFEWWAFEVLALLSGLLPNAVLGIGANAVVMNISSMIYMIYLGLSISGGIRIGNALGAGLPRRACLAAQLTTGISLIVSLFCAAFLLLFRKKLPLLFTHDKEIADLASTILVVCVCFQIPDAMNSCVQGIFRGSGSQAVGAKLNFVAYYIVGIPLGCIFAFLLHQGVVGLWIGMTLGLCLSASVGLTLIFSYTDWVSLAKGAGERIQD